MTPLPGESQPQFAIRFHTAMAATIPSAQKRNQACMNAWRKSPNHSDLIRAIDARFPVSQYRRVRDVHCFEEHELPESTLPDGTVIPPKKYSRTELAEMVDGMNSRIMDHEHFAPLSKGHTVIDDSGNLKHDPEVLGFTGPYYLGQVGETNPRWGIFEDEYHRLDAVPELDRRRNRSPEVWPYRNARDRFFHPVAALGAEMPRLNLMPARYSRSVGNERIFVEFYGATSPFGGNTSTPTFSAGTPNMDPNQLGQQPPQDPMSQGGGEGDAGNVPAIVEEIISGLMETPPFQFLMQLYNERQQSDAKPPMAGSGSPADMAGGAPPAPAAAVPAAPAAPVPPAAATSPGDPSRYSRQIQDLNHELAQVRQQAAAERMARVRLERYSRLAELSRDFNLIPDEELDRTAEYSDEQFAAHCSMITERYSRNPQSVPDFASLAGIGVPPKGPRQPANSLSKDDAEAVAKLATEKGLSYGAARDLYMRNRNSVAVS